MGFKIINKTRSKLPEKNLKKIKNKILGKSYDLSAAALTEKEMREVNEKYSKKSGAATVLAFPLSENSGEILLCPSYIKKRSKDFEIGFNACLQKIFIHGLLHLKGLKHGKEMGGQENKFFALLTRTPKK